ncbi:MAG: hypothetical protein KGK07_16360 [Chloroflexota bacterium]|nr:hypothetical protein [Chloroflexota bacterium]
MKTAASTYHFLEHAEFGTVSVDEHGLVTGDFLREAHAQGICVPRQLCTCGCDDCCENPVEQRLLGDGFYGGHHWDCQCDGCRAREEYEQVASDEEDEL